MTKHKIFTMSVASVYPHYVTKAEKKGREKTEIDEIIRWLTGYSQKELESQLEKQTDFETFFTEAPQLNPSRRSYVSRIEKRALMKLSHEFYKQSQGKGYWWEVCPVGTPPAVFFKRVFF
jgi:hypothetical protein